jgi:hypothetical protein
MREIRHKKCVDVVSVRGTRASSKSGSSSGRSSGSSTFTQVKSDIRVEKWKVELDEVEDPLFTSTFSTMIQSTFHSLSTRFQATSTFHEDSVWRDRRKVEASTRSTSCCCQVEVSTFPLFLSSVFQEILHKTIVHPQCCAAPRQNEKIFFFPLIFFFFFFID